MPGRKLTVSERVFLILSFATIIGTCATLILMARASGTCG